MVAAVLFVAVDLGGPVRAFVTLVALLVAPGLAATRAMGPMEPETRALITVVTSAALTATIATVMSVIGRWSPGVGLAVVTAITLALLTFPDDTGGDHGDSGADERNQAPDDRGRDHTDGIERAS